MCLQIKLEKAYSSNQALYSIVRTRSYHYTVYTRPVCTCTWIESRRLALARRREFGGGRRRPQTLRRCHRCRLTPSPPPPSPPLTLQPPSPPDLHRPASPPSPQRCRRHQPSTSLPPIAAAHAASVAAASIDRLHRSLPSPPLASPPLPKGEAARERERERSRLYGYKVRVRVRVRERVATSQSGGPWRNRTSTTLRP